MNEERGGDCDRRKCSQGLNYHGHGLLCGSAARETQSGFGKFSLKRRFPRSGQATSKFGQPSLSPIFNHHMIVSTFVRVSAFALAFTLGACVIPAFAQIDEEEGADSLQTFFTSDEMPDEFVHLSDVAPEIAQEMRYFTGYNFVGEPIDGYEAPECILTREAAEALKHVAQDLAQEGLGLKVYDCYRPQRAVDHFISWFRNDDQTMKRAFYPAEPKDLLFRRGFISARSGHSRGSTVDLTLVRLPVEESVLTEYPSTFEEFSICYHGRGNGESTRTRLYERDLDMGTAYDCLDPESATFMMVIEGEVLENRQKLVDAMSQRGFSNYAQEWWHFTLRGEPFPDRYFDIPVR